MQLRTASCEITLLKIRSKSLAFQPQTPPNNQHHFSHIGQTRRTTDIELRSYHTTATISAMASSTSAQQAITLYEGNFTAWESSLRALLATHRLDHLLQDSPQAFPQSGGEKAQTSAALSMIKALVRPELLQRIPRKNRRDARTLVSKLKARAKPFRFLDLPPEIRNIVYEIILPNGKEVQVSGRVTGGPTTVSSPRPFWAITQASQLIREESNLLLYSRCHIRLSLSTSRPTTEVCGQTAHLWASKMTAEQRQSLRKVTIQALDPLGQFLNPKSVTLTFCPMNGLEAKLNGHSSDKVHRSLNDLVEKIESIRKMISLQGEAIILALAMDARTTV